MIDGNKLWSQITSITVNVSFEEGYWIASDDFLELKKDIKNGKYDIKKSKGDE